MKMRSSPAQMNSGEAMLRNAFARYLDEPRLEQVMRIINNGRRYALDEKAARINKIETDFPEICGALVQKYASIIYGNSEAFDIFLGDMREKLDIARRLVLEVKAITGQEMAIPNEIRLFERLVDNAKILSVDLETRKAEIDSVVSRFGTKAFFSKTYVLQINLQKIAATAAKKNEREEAIVKLRTELIEALGPDYCPAIDEQIERRIEARLILPQTVLIRLEFLRTRGLLPYLPSRLMMLFYQDSHFETSRRAMEQEKEESKQKTELCERLAGIVGLRKTTRTIRRMEEHALGAKRMLERMDEIEKLFGTTAMQGFLNRGTDVLLSSEPEYRSWLDAAKKSLIREQEDGEALRMLRALLPEDIYDRMLECKGTRMRNLRPTTILARVSQLAAIGGGTIESTFSGATRFQEIVENNRNGRGRRSRYQTFAIYQTDVEQADEALRIKRARAGIRLSDREYGELKVPVGNEQTSSIFVFNNILEFMSGVLPHAQARAQLVQAAEEGKIFLIAKRLDELNARCGPKLTAYAVKTSWGKIQENGNWQEEAETIYKKYASEQEFEQTAAELEKKLGISLPFAYDEAALVNLVADQRDGRLMVGILIDMQLRGTLTGLEAYKVLKTAARIRNGSNEQILQEIEELKGETAKITQMYSDWYLGSYSSEMIRFLLLNGYATSIERASAITIIEKVDALATALEDHYSAFIERNLGFVKTDEFRRTLLEILTTTRSLEQWAEGESTPEDDLVPMDRKLRTPAEVKKAKNAKAGTRPSA